DLYEDWEESEDLVGLESRYAIQHEWGRGGMGAVYFAVDRRLQRPVAIKRLREDLKHTRKADQRFLTEARAIAQLNHFNIVHIYDFGRAADGLFLVMELVDGESLADRLKRTGPCDVEQAVEWTVQICDALTLSHGRGIIHRDIKPGNILITKSGVPKLTDFGLARLDVSESGQTQTGAVLGTIDFMAPEQHRDAHTADARSDIWSLGATLYQIVTGNSPRIIRTDRIPKRLRAVIVKSLEDDPSARFQSSAEFREALAAVVDSPSTDSGRFTVARQGECSQCGRVNGAEKKFCEDCGVSLVEPCLQCKSPVSGWTQYCGECGANVSELLGTRIRELESQRRLLPAMAAEFRFLEATALLEKTAKITHPRLQNFAAWAKTELPAIQQQAHERKKWAAEQLRAAREAVQRDASYSRAGQLLEQIPESQRSQEMQELLDHCRACHEELQQLAAEIRSATGKRLYDGLLPKVERFVELKPNHEASQTLLKNLRGRLRPRRRQPSHTPPPLPPGPSRYARSQRRVKEPPSFPVLEPNAAVAEIRQICERHSQNGYYTADGFPRRKLDNARNSYRIPDHVDVIGLIDCTVFGSAKDGLAICSDGIYWHNQFEPPCFIPWREFADLSIQTNGVFQIQFGTHGGFNTAGSSCGRGWAVSLLQTIQSAAAFSL
ncbi:MAG: protein kinase, partial [Planctomycetes bacterium]|nr:protein kinase [Planctomycetota bacterium]